MREIISSIKDFSIVLLFLICAMCCEMMGVMGVMVGVMGVRCDDVMMCVPSYNDVIGIS